MTFHSSLKLPPPHFPSPAFHKAQPPGKATYHCCYTSHALSCLCVVDCALLPFGLFFLSHMERKFRIRRWFLTCFLGPVAEASPGRLLEVRNFGPIQHIKLDTLEVEPSSLVSGALQVTLSHHTFGEL